MFYNMSYVNYRSSGVSFRTLTPFSLQRDDVRSRRFRSVDFFFNQRELRQEVPRGTFPCTFVVLLDSARGRHGRSSSKSCAASWIDHFPLFFRRDRTALPESERALRLPQNLRDLRRNPLTPLCLPSRVVAGKDDENVFLRIHAVQRIS